MNNYNFYQVEIKRIGLGKYVEIETNRNHNLDVSDEINECKVIIKALDRRRVKFILSSAQTQRISTW